MYRYHEDHGRLDLVHVMRSDPFEPTAYSNIHTTTISSIQHIRDKPYMCDKTGTLITHCLRHHMIL